MTIFFKKGLGLLLFIACFFINTTQGQDFLNNKNISSVKIDLLSDAEISKLLQQLKTSNISIGEAEQIAQSKGMPASEASKLRLRLENLSKTTSYSNSGNQTQSNEINNNNSAIRNYVPINDQISSINDLNDKIFGSELFHSNSLSFEPNLHLPTPSNYILGPDDGLLINIFGLQEVSFNPTISSEGTIYIPTVGVIRLSGMTIQQATNYLRERLSNIGYRSLKTGASKLTVSLSKIRSIGITIIGAVKSGSYTISSLSTLFNALYISGGPGVNRSFRKIQLIRNNEVFKTVDLYNFLLTGSEKDNVSLRDNDIIRLPVYETRVEIEGEIKRPGIFELLPHESLQDLIRFTGGFTDSAYRASIKVIQLTNKEKRVKDIYEPDFSQYMPSTGDYFEVTKILNRFENRVTISGAVFRPGIYEMSDGLTVGKLISKAEGLKEDAFMQRGQIVRLKPDNSSEILSFDVSKVITGQNDDIKLKREDSVIIYSTLNLRDVYTVNINGEIRQPGEYPFKEGLSLKDLIIEAGGFTYGAYPQRIEIARLIKRSFLLSNDNRLSEIIDVQNINDLSEDKKVLLEPFDVITIRRMPGYFMPQGVTVTGMVQFPGTYILSSRTEKVVDIIKRSGGFLPEAYPQGTYLKRLNNTDSSQKIIKNVVGSIEKQVKDTSAEVLSSVSRPFDLIPLDLNNILSNPASEYNLVLRPQDELHIPRNDQEIKISGAVFFPTQSPYLVKNSVKDYIDLAGGFTDFAQRKRLFILYPNGKAVSTKHFLFFHHYPKIQPGAEIIVPKKNQRKKLSTAETIGISSALASLAGVVIAIIQLTKK